MSKNFRAPKPVSKSSPLPSPRQVTLVSEGQLSTEVSLILCLYHGNKNVEKRKGAIDVGGYSFPAICNLTACVTLSIPPT